MYFKLFVPDQFPGHMEGLYICIVHFVKYPRMWVSVSVHIYGKIICFFFLFSDSSLSKTSPCSEAGKPCNPCLDATKACNLNETCKRLRSAYNSICSKATPPQLSAANQEPCSKKRCQKVGTLILGTCYERQPELENCLILTMIKGETV